MKKSGFIKFILFFLFLSVISNASADELKIGITYDIPPYIMNEGTAGLEIDILREGLKSYGYTFTTEQHSYKELETAVTKLGLDAAAGVRYLDDGTFYSDNFITFENYAISKQKADMEIATVEDLVGLNIVTWQNAHRDLGDDFAKYFSPNIKTDYIKKYHEEPDQREQVKMFWLGGADVIIIDKAIFIWLTKELSAEIDINDEPAYHKIFPLVTEFQVNFADRQIRDDFNEGLKQIRKTGIYQKIFHRYLQ